MTASTTRPSPSTTRATTSSTVATAPATPSNPQVVTTVMPYSKAMAPPAPPTTAAACTDGPGSETDLRNEPWSYEQLWNLGEHLRRWTNDSGCPTRTDVIALVEFQPWFHCATWPAQVVLGPRFPDARDAEYRRYLRQPPTPSWLAEEAPLGYSASATVPEDARATAYTIDDRRLWVADTQAYVWLVGASSAERLPLSRTIGCA